MTEDELIRKYPVLYHMAARCSWSAIKEYGLLSTSALLDLYAIHGQRRDEIERQHRPESIPIQRDGLPGAVIRDQKPMSDTKLERCLPSHLRPSDWYALLNSKVFFWLTEERLHTMTGAAAYMDHEHEVLEVCTRSLVGAHRKMIWLCPINSGSTLFNPPYRDENTFARIADYQKNGVKELAVAYAVPDILNHVRKVIVKRCDKVIKVIWERP